MLVFKLKIKMEAKKNGREKAEKRRRKKILSLQFSGISPKVYGTTGFKIQGGMTIDYTDKHTQDNGSCVYYW